MEAYEKIARILRTDKDYVLAAAKSLSQITGQNNILEQIVAENEEKINRSLNQLKLKKKSADMIFQALLEKVKSDEQVIFEHFGRPRCEADDDCHMLLAGAKKLANINKGYFLKKEKAKEFLVNEPPKKVLAFFNKENIGELLEDFDLFEIYSALRFVEDRAWLNNVFFKQLERVKPDDFEEREVEIFILHHQWLKAAESFLDRKYHNVSHLKELGVIFVIPIKIDTPGETLRIFSLLLHYLHEIDFYSKLFQKYAREDPTSMASKIIAALRGDVLNSRFAEKERGRKWMIVQRYLAKEDPYDWRLFEPHINPEAVHWGKAEADIARLDEEIAASQFNFWKDLDWVGDYFSDDAGGEVLVSFNLIDTIMSLVKKKELIKYLYHHQEALWNYIFIKYFGEEKTQELLFQNFDQGFIEL